MKEIAEKMGFESKNAAKMQKHRCIRKLIGLVKGNPETEQTVLELLRI